MLARLSFRAGPFCIAFVASLLCAQPQAWQAIGYVLDFKGKWTLSDSSKALSKWEPLPAHGMLHNPSPADDDRIVVVNLNGDVIQRIHCTNKVCKACSGESGPCYDPIQKLPDSRQRTGVFATVFHAVMELVVGKPARYSVHRVRGQRLSDAVLRLDDGRCDLGPVFASQEKGRYRIRFASIGSDADSSRTWKSDPISFDWDPARPGLTSIGGLDRGLYALVLFDADMGGSAPLMDAWVLMTTADEYPKVASAFQTAAAQAAKWGDSVSAATTQGFLRANLDYLANQSIERRQRDAPQ